MDEQKIRIVQEEELLMLVIYQSLPLPISQIKTKSDVADFGPKSTLFPALPKSQILTNIDDWTTAFNTYVLIVVQKFPVRASELLLYMETIRHAARTNGGLA